MPRVREWLRRLFPRQQDSKRGPTKEHSGKHQSFRLRHLVLRRSIQPAAALEGRLKQDRCTLNYPGEVDDPRRIYIIGTGSIGKLVAHAIRGLPEAPPVTLIFHHESLLKAWVQSKKAITVYHGKSVITRGGFDVELAQAAARARTRTDKASKATSIDVHEREDFARMQEKVRQPANYQNMLDRGISIARGKHEQESLADSQANSTCPIQNLIIATKVTETIAALGAIRHRLSARSSLCFLQNGLGIIDQVNRTVFKDVLSRPYYIQGIVSHGAYATPKMREHDPFAIVHARRGTIFLGLAPTQPWMSLAAWPRTAVVLKHIRMTYDSDSKSSDEQRRSAKSDMISFLEKCSSLSVACVPPVEFLQLQMEKLSMNAIINPLTALLNCSCSNLLQSPAMRPIVRIMVDEVSSVMRRLPELRCLPNSQHRFASYYLEQQTVLVSKTSGDHSSSMLADFRAGRRTEIEYITGYILQRARELNLECPVNSAIYRAVLDGCPLTEMDVCDLAMRTEA